MSRTRHSKKTPDEEAIKWIAKTEDQEGLHQRFINEFIGKTFYTAQHF